MPPLRLERVVLVDDRVAPPPVRDAPFFRPPNDFILANKPPFLLVVLVVAAAADDEDTAVLGSVRRLLLPTLWGVDGVDRYLVSQTWRKKLQKALVFGRSGHVRQNINNQDQNNGSYIDKMPKGMRDCLFTLRSILQNTQRVIPTCITMHFLYWDRYSNIHNK
jgi:hypothetical protein